MDLWNNSVGRAYGKKAKSWDELYQMLMKSLKEGELIIEPSDKRKYLGDRSIKRQPKSFVIKIKGSFQVDLYNMSLCEATKNKAP